MGRKKPQAEPEPPYDVDIWNIEGDVVKHFREITADDVDELRVSATPLP